MREVEAQGVAVDLGFLFCVVALGDEDVEVVGPLAVFVLQIEAGERDADVDGGFAGGGDIGCDGVGGD